MPILNSVAECLSYIDVCTVEYPVLSEIINPNDRLAWEVKLAAVESLDDFILGRVQQEKNPEDEESPDVDSAPVEYTPQPEDTKLNLLNVTITAGLCMANGYETDHCQHARRLLTKLSLYLNNFPGLKSDKNFLGKIKNLIGLNFLATLSELSLAYKLSSGGLDITFETPFILPGTTKRKDVDLTVRSSTGQVFHLEVYMPGKSAHDGFFDLKDDDRHFEYKVWKKLADKFGKKEISELNGLVLLAVNIAFMDMLRIKSTFDSLHNNYDALTQLIPSHIDGLILFVDDFGADNSFCFDRLLLSK